jgi:hypothetical protein
MQNAFNCPLKDLSRRACECAKKPSVIVFCKIGKDIAAAAARSERHSVVSEKRSLIAVSALPDAASSFVIIIIFCRPKSCAKKVVRVIGWCVACCFFLTRLYCQKSSPTHKSASTVLKTFGPPCDNDGTSAKATATPYETPVLLCSGE